VKIHRCWSLTTYIVPGLMSGTIWSGLSNENLFKSEGDRKVLQQLVSLYNEGKATVTQIHI
jgi:hypothetical protein